MNTKKGEEIFEKVITPTVQNRLQVLAGVTEDDYTITERGFVFKFKNSNYCNQCRVIEYHNQVILELRKKTDNLFEGKTDQLVFEDIINPQSFEHVFEDKTGIYLSYEGL